MSKSSQDLRREARELDRKADEMDAQKEDCGCEIAKAAVGAAVRTGVPATIAATTGIIIPSL
ncbi:MAG: hypothetical protein N4A65_04785 [Cohaesibacter sp.]|nr:hypothetical protein [Cohaesibacter sp.]